MSAAGDLFARRDRIEQILHRTIDDHTTDSESPAYTDAIRRAAETLLGSFEISDGRSEGVRIQYQTGGFVHGPTADQAEQIRRQPHADQAELSRQLGRTEPTFRETEHARRMANRSVYNTPAENIIVPIIVGWAHKSNVPDLILEASQSSNGKIEVTKVEQLDDDIPGSLAEARIDFMLWMGGRRVGASQVEEIRVSGNDAKRAIRAWKNGQS